MSARNLLAGRVHRLFGGAPLGMSPAGAMNTSRRCDALSLFSALFVVGYSLGCQPSPEDAFCREEPDRCADSSGVPTCTDGDRNGRESDIDCGGSCDRCADGRTCGSPHDCASGYCHGGVCGCQGRVGCACDPGVSSCAAPLSCGRTWENEFACIPGGVAGRWLMALDCQFDSATGKRTRRDTVALDVSDSGTLSGNGTVTICAYDTCGTIYGYSCHQWTRPLSGYVTASTGAFRLEWAAIDPRPGTSYDDWLAPGAIDGTVAAEVASGSYVASGEFQNHCAQMLGAECRGEYRLWRCHCDDTSTCQLRDGSVGSTLAATLPTPIPVCVAK